MRGGRPSVEQSRGGEDEGARADRHDPRTGGHECENLRHGCRRFPADLGGVERRDDDGVGGTQSLRAVLDGDREVGVGAYRAAVGGAGQDLVAAACGAEDAVRDAQVEGVHPVGSEDDDTVHVSHGRIPSKVGNQATVADGSGDDAGRMTNTETMRAISQDTYGTPEVLKEVLIPKPAPGLSEILVAVHAAGVNPTDWRNRAQVATIARMPLVLGWDVSGVVEAVGIGVTLFKPGDEVFGMLPYPGGVGSHAEYVTGPARAFTHKPAGIDHIQAGALPLAALTAYQALVETADVRAGQRVLIHAAAGGVGHLAVQIAKSRGAYVIGTASAAKHDFVRSLGADEVIDYHTVDFAEAVADIDVVLDSVSFDSGARARSLDVLRPGGTLVSILPVPIEADELATIAERGVRFESLLVEADHAGMQAIADLVETGALRAHIEATFPLAEAAKAHALGETNRTTGKIVLTVQEVPESSANDNTMF